METMHSKADRPLLNNRTKKIKQILLLPSCMNLCHKCMYSILAAPELA